jgi:hypothetical protein
MTVVRSIKLTKYAQKNLLVIFLFHLVTKWEALSAHFFIRKNGKPCAPLVGTKKTFLFDQTVYFVSRNMPKKIA